MRGEGIARRYAAALYDLCNGVDSKAELYLDILDSISSVFNYPEIRKVLSSPVVSSKLKGEVLNNLFEQTSTDQLFTSFLNEVARSQRVSILPQIAAAFRKILYEHQGVVEANAVTVVELSEYDRDVIRNKLEHLTGKKVKLTSRVDSSVLGGFVIYIGNSVLDMSLKSKLDAMTQSAAR